MWETTSIYVKQDKNGNDKNVRMNVIVENQPTFGAAESLLYHTFSDELTGFEVVAIRQSKVKEIANSSTSDDDLIWCAELQDVFHDDDGSEKTLRYKILLFAKTFDSAKAFISEYMKQAYDMSLVSLKLTRFIDVI